MESILILISALFQVAFFALIPFVFYLIKNKSKKGFLDFIGLFKTNIKAIFLSLLVAIAYFGLSWFTYNALGLLGILHSSANVGSAVRIYGFGFTGISIVLIKAILSTALSEEIFFRGFLAKIFIKKIGFANGNLLQSFLFGLMHAVLFWGQTDILGIAIITALTGAVGFSMCYINEKYGKGSILPSWGGSFSCKFANDVLLR